jgi:(heptosyl)LPS beta-1,4-glucosyltransferase
MKPGISAIVIAHNQVDLLKKCLSSLSWVDEIIVVDLESTEDVSSVAAKFKATYKKNSQVQIVEQVRQKSLQYATHEYVLFLDPDETIPPALAKVLIFSLQNNPAFVKIPRANYIFGKWIEHTLWWPDYQVRLFQKEKISWPTTLHAQPTVEGEGITLPPVEENAIHHLNYVTLDEWIDKNRRYAKENAAELLESSTIFTLSDALKKSIGEITRRFFKSYGYADGLHGLMLSILQSFYYFLVYAYYWEGKKYAELETPSAIKSFPQTWFSHGLSETLYWNKLSSPLKKIKAKLVRRMIA